MKTKFGVRTKLQVFILPTVVISLFVVVLVSYFTSKGIIRTKTEKLIDAQAESSANAIETSMAADLAVLDNLTDTMLNMNFTDEQYMEYGLYYLDTYENFPNGLYMVSDSGEYLDPSGYEMEGDPRDGNWYREGVNHPDKFQFGEPYLDNMTKAYVVTASRYIQNFNGRGVVLSADIDLSTMANIVSALEVEGNGEAFIVHGGDGTILAHNDDAMIGQNVADIEDAYYAAVFEKITTGQMENESISSLQGLCMTSIEPIEGTEWFVVTRALDKKIFVDMYRLAVILAVIGVLAVVAVGLVVLVIVNKITKPIKSLTNSIVDVTNGDFTTKVEVTGKDEISVMARCMSEFLEVMRTTLGTIVNISDQIDSQAAVSNQISGELHDSAGEQSNAMEQLRDNLQELVESITVIAENATTLATVVAETNDEGDEALVYVQQTMKEADGGRKSMDSVNESMIEMQSGMEELEVSITDVGEAAVKINEITDTIRSIADETNLLALNASIEAARAGEAGKGFAVVATEIGKLADTSGHAAEEISQLIGDVTQQIEVTVKQSHHSMDQIRSSAEMVGEASEQFNSIFESIEHTNEIIKSMIEKIANVNDVATNMAAITEEQSASAEEIEATATNMQELASSVTDNSATVKNDSDVLAGTADNLKTEISRFTIS